MRGTTQRCNILFGLSNMSRNLARGKRAECWRYEAKWCLRNCEFSSADRVSVGCLIKIGRR